MSALPSPILVRFHGLPAGLAKHLRVHEAVAGAVRAGELAMGTRLAGERELSRELGLSLGTTQKALGRLVAEGFLVRRQGDGTYVGSVRRPVSGSWHYRFLDDDGRCLPVFTTLLERRRVGDDGPWHAALGPDPAGYVMVRRRLDIGGRFHCASRIWLPASRFGRLLRIALRRLTDTNLKTLLESDFVAPTLTADGVAHVMPIDVEDAGVVGVKPRTAGLRVDIVGRSFGQVPITFQRMIVPPTRYGLQLDFDPPRGDAAGDSVPTAAAVADAAPIAAVRSRARR